MSSMIISIQEKCLPENLILISRILVMIPYLVQRKSLLLEEKEVLFPG
jgi:hypothetical protein